MSCEKIDPKDFHGPAARRYTEQCLDDLATSKTFNSYVNHVEYEERLYLTWFLAPLGLVAVVYYHILAIDTNLFMFTSAGEDRTIAGGAGMGYASLFLLALVIPWTVMAPFVGFFEEPTRLQSVCQYCLFTAANVAVVSFGGEFFHHPPFINASPTVASLLGTPCSLVKVVLVRALPMQGFITAGFLVSESRRAFWRRAWHPPLPLFTIPILASIFSVLWWRAVSLTIPYFFSEIGGPTSVSTASTPQKLFADPNGVLSLWRTIGAEVTAVLWDDIQRLTVSAGDTFLLQGDSGVELYSSLLSMALLYFVVLLVRPILEVVIAALMMVLPTHPTTWGISMAACVAGLVVVLQLPSIPIVYPVGIVVLMFSLLYNGFMA